MSKTFNSHVFRSSEIDSFRDRFNSTVCPNELFMEEADQRFSARFEEVNLGSVHLYRYEGQGIRGGCREPRHIDAKPEDAFLLILPVDGQMDITQSGLSHRIEPGRFAFLATDLPSLSECGKLPDHAYSEFVIKVPGSLLRQVVPGVDDICTIPIDACTSAGSVMQDMIVSLMKQGRGISKSQAPMFGSALVHAIAGAVLDSRELFLSGKYHPIQRHDRLRLRALAYMEANLSDAELTPQQVADFCGVSLRYLQVAFEANAMSIATVIREMRLQACYRELAHPAGVGRSILDIALSWGFVNAASFTRAFRRQYGILPREVRRQSTRH